MDAADRSRIVEALTEAFGDARDVTPNDDQPLHVLLSSLSLPPPWRPNPTRGLVKFEKWPSQRPGFWIEMAVVNRESQPPRSSSAQLVLGETWRQFSFSFVWPVEPPTPEHAVLKWLTRFREAT
jgi:hypothetical protein